jgi:hypothetical protein
MAYKFSQTARQVGSEHHPFPTVDGLSAEEVRAIQAGELTVVFKAEKRSSGKNGTYWRRATRLYGSRTIAPRVATQAEVEAAGQTWDLEGG